jgi:hypothetical protein
MQPRFLHNALNTIAALVRDDPAAADAALLGLSQLLRAAIQASRRPLHRLAGELADLGPGFVRMHRSRAVALSAVSGLEAAGRGQADVRLRDGTRLACSPAGRQALQQALGAASG